MNMFASNIEFSMSLNITKVSSHFLRYLENVSDLSDKLEVAPS